MPKPVVVQRVGLTLDLILWRAYGRPGQAPALLRAGYTLNPGLAVRGAVLALGSTVILPDLPPASSTRTRRTVDLFSA